MNPRTAWAIFVRLGIIIPGMFLVFTLPDGFELRIVGCLLITWFLFDIQMMNRTGKLLP